MKWETEQLKVEFHHKFSFNSYNYYWIQQFWIHITFSPKDLDFWFESFYRKPDMRFKSKKYVWLSNHKSFFRCTFISFYFSLKKKFCIQRFCGLPELEALWETPSLFILLLSLGVMVQMNLFSLATTVTNKWLNYD